MFNTKCWNLHKLVAAKLNNYLLTRNTPSSIAFTTRKRHNLTEFQRFDKVKPSSCSIPWRWKLVASCPFESNGGCMNSTIRAVRLNRKRINGHSQLPCDGPIVVQLPHLSGYNIRYVFDVEGCLPVLLHRLYDSCRHPMVRVMQNLDRLSANRWIYRRHLYH